MTAAALPPPPPDDDSVPTRAAAVELSRRLLGDQGTRFQHVCRAGEVAQELAALFDAQENHLLVAAATLHDIGYAPTIAHTGFHPLDGGRFLRDHGYSPRLAGLVAHHSHAELMAPDARTRELLKEFPQESTLLADALAFADMHSDPAGRSIHVEQRYTDIERRHPGPHAKQRTVALRRSVARVRTALASQARDGVG